MRQMLFLSVILLLCGGADWPQFRGKEANGVSDEIGLPATWSDSENIAWKIDLPCYGASSPISLGGKLFITGYSGYGTKTSEGADASSLKRHIICIEGATGEIVWNTALDSAPGDKSYSNFIALHGYASHTPVTDGKRVYAYFGKTGAVAVNIDDGKVLWKADCGSGTHTFGTGASPVLFGDTLIVNAGVESRTLVALNKKTGKEAWRGGNINLAWNTPLLVETDAGPELVVSMKNRIVAYDPKTGTDLWHCDGIADYVCPSAIEHDGVIYAIGGRGRNGLAVRAGGRGDVTETHRLYQLDRGSNVSSPLYHNNRLYWAHDSNGIVYCANAKTGEILYEKRLEPRPGKIYASPLLADGKLYFVSREKGAYVLAPGDEFKLLAHNKFAQDDSIFNASPIVLKGSIILRSDKHLYRIGKK